MRLRMLAAIGMIAAVLVAAAPAGAFLLQDRLGPLSATNGIVLGPDGNFWIAEQFADSVLRMRPDGTVLDHYPLGLGAAPTTVTTGPGGRVWVAATGADKLVWIDATAATPATHDVPTTLAAGGSDCGPVALAAGGDGRMYFSLPFDSMCVQGARLGSVADDGSGAITTDVTTSTVFEFAVVGGKLFAPDFDGSVVRRLALPTLTTEATITAPPGSGPQGVTADGAGNIWFTEFAGGSVGRFAATAPNATVATTITPSGGPLAQPVGIVAGADGALYVAGSGSANVVRISADGTRFAFFPEAGGGKPFRIVNGVDGDLWFTDQLTNRVVRLVSGAPRTTLVAAAAASPTTAAVLASIDPRGNDTAVFFDFGTTVNYGSATTPIGVAAGLNPVSISNALTGLAPATTYHVRARATNADGTTVSPDTTFTTAAAPPGAKNGLPRLKVATSFGYTRSATSLVLRRIGLTKLAGGETATIRCTGSTRCPFKVRTFKRLKKGSRAFGKALLKKRKLPVGTTISVRVTKTGAVGTSATLKVRRRKAPQITRLCLPPGATAPAKCT
jgi:streptogramin lyase